MSLRLLYAEEPVSVSLGEMPKRRSMLLACMYCSHANSAAEERASSISDRVLQASLKVCCDPIASSISDRVLQRRTPTACCDSASSVAHNLSCSCL
jgi:hypothetical protein